jgi:hypothetical protein
MKNKSAVFLALVFLFFSCDSSFRIEKRRYMKGYYVATHSDRKSPSAKIPDYINPINTTSIFSENDSSSIQTPVQIIVSNTKTQSSKKEKEKTTSLSVTKTKENGFSKKVTQEDVLAVINNKTSKNKKQNGLFLLFAISGLFGFSFWSLSKHKSGTLHKMKFWAFNNKFKGFSIIVLAKAYSIITAFWIGVKLFELNFSFPSYTMNFLFCSLALVLAFNALRKRTTENIFNFFKNKLPAVFLSIIGVLLCVTLGNKVATENANGTNLNRHLNKRCANFFESKSAFTQTTSDDVTAIKPDKGDAGTTALKVILTILAILSIVVLEALTIAYSCVLVCSGAEAEAVLLAVFGTVFIAFLAIVTFYWISRINLSDEKSQGQAG